MTVQLGPHAIDLLRASGWRSGSGSSAASAAVWPFGGALPAAVALAHAAQPDRLCAETLRLAELCVKLRSERRLLRRVLDGVRRKAARDEGERVVALLRGGGHAACAARVWV